MDPLASKVATRYIQAQDEKALEALADYWVDAFLDEFIARADIGEREVELALRAKGVSADDLNAVSPGTKEAGFKDTVKVLGGLVLRGIWHMTIHPFLAIVKFFRSPQFRSEVKVAFNRALRHEVRATKHLADVAGRLARGEEVNIYERKTAMHQFVDILTKAVLIYFAGPHITHFFAGGFWQVVAAIVTPLDEIIVILVDKPVRAAAKKLLNADLGMLPSGFYTHF